MSLFKNPMVPTDGLEWPMTPRQRATCHGRLVLTWKIRGVSKVETA